MASKFSRQLLKYRTYATDHTTAASAGEHGAGKSTWKWLAYVVAVPSCLLCGINTYMIEKEHKEHYQRPDFVAYEHLRMRTKPFPFGDGNHTLFHNRNNALPTGYED